jgi:hypothetical protein
MRNEEKPSQMLRVPNALIDAVRSLSRLHRQGRSTEVLSGLDNLIKTLEFGNGSGSNGAYQTISRLNALKRSERTHW